MTKVYAPYHFVPVSQWVYMPDWAHLVSHDVPFKAGVSGRIEYTLKNVSELCVGSGTDKDVNTRKGEGASTNQWARDPKGRLLIPGTSIKGMIRNVLEIASFAKLADQIDDDNPILRGVPKENKGKKATKDKKVMASVSKYTYLIGDLAKRQQSFTDEHTFDLPELMFGTLRERGYSLKSRVSFTDLRAESSPRVTKTPVLLASPKPSFINTYLTQKGQTLKSYNDQDSELAGWKRYRLAHAFKSNVAVSSGKKSETESVGEFIAPGNAFKGSVVFHNLHPSELAALVWCLTLGETQADKHFHSVGYGKSLGAGRVQCHIDSISTTEETSANYEVEALNTAFVDHMNQVYPTYSGEGWSQSIQMRHLTLLTSLVTSNIEYMSLKEFNSVKGKQYALPKLVDRHEQDSSSIPANKLLPMSYGRGRLSGLFNDNNDPVLQEARDQQEKQNKLAEFPAELQSVHSKALEYKDASSKTAKKEHSKALRELVKHIDVESLSQQGAQFLLATCELVEHKSTNKLAVALKRVLNGE